MKGLVFLGVTVVGFLAGFAIGAKTREETESNTEISMSGGVVTVRSDLGKSIKDGAGRAIADWLTG